MSPKQINSSLETSGIQATNNPDEIDLIQFFLGIKRQWKFAVIGSIAGAGYAGYVNLTTQPVYQGEFQIVLGNKNSGGGAALMQQNSALALLGNGMSDNTSTEIEILNSPSVLLPVFEAVKARKNPEVADKMKFEKWAASSVSVFNTKGTSILEVQYRDKDQKIILPVTELISKEYQKYSNRGRSAELDNTIEYLTNQISIFKPKSTRSTREALDYGYRHGLGVSDGLPLAGTISGAGMESQRVQATSSSVVDGQGGSVEQSKTRVQQKVLGLEVQIEEAKKAGNGSIYVASQISNLTDKSSTFDKLTEIETSLADARSRFRENDPYIKTLTRSRNVLIEYINRQTISLLQGELALAKANLKALDRPREIVNKHRELMQIALRDAATLVTLENQLKQYELEKAREPSPWELISTPRVLTNPVSPNKKKTLGLGLLGGLLVGSFAAVVVDQKKGLIFSHRELKNKIPYPLLRQLKIEKRDDIVETIKLLCEGPLSNYSTVAIIPIGDIKTESLNELCSVMEQSSQVKASIKRKLLDSKESEIKLLIASPGAVSRQDLQCMKEQLALQCSSVLGWILFS